MQTQTATPTPSILPTRRLTVCGKAFDRQTSRRYVWFPAISLCGKWLHDSGFSIGQVVEVSCEEGKLILTLAAEQRPMGG